MLFEGERDGEVIRIAIPSGRVKRHGRLLTPSRHGGRLRIQVAGRKHDLGVLLTRITYGEGVGTGTREAWIPVSQRMCTFAWQCICFCLSEGRSDPSYARYLPGTS